MKPWVNTHLCLAALWLGTVTFAPAATAARFSYEDLADAVNRLFSEPEAISSEIFNSPLSVDASSLLGAEDHIDVSLADGIDYDTIVREELLQRKGNDLPDACTDCVVPLAVKACQVAWQKLQTYCDKHTDDKSQEACKRYRADPKDFLVTRVLRAGVNPIDAGYSVCWWRGKCK